MLKYFPIFLILSYTNIFAQASQQNLDSVERIKQDSLIDDTRLCWATGGIGVYGPGITTLLKLTYSWGKNNISVKYLLASPLNLGSDGGTDENLTEIAVLFGRQKFSRGMLGRISGGLSYLPVAQINQKDVRGLGLCGEMELIFKASPVGIGLMISILATPKYFSGGLTLNLHFGKLEEWSQYEN